MLEFGIGDPQTRTLPSGKAVAEFSLATDYRWEDPHISLRKESVEFHDVIAYGKLAEIIGPVRKERE
jgi:single-strand DNA-binding protein